MEQRTVITATGLSGPAGAPRPWVASGTCTAEITALMGTRTGWLMADGKQRILRDFTAAPNVPNHPARRLEEASP